MFDLIKYLDVSIPDHVDPSSLVKNHHGKIPLTKFKLGIHDFEVDKDSFKKFLIVSLLSKHGKVKPLPKYTSAVVQRSVKGT